MNQRSRDLYTDPHNSSGPYPNAGRSLIPGLLLVTTAFVAASFFFSPLLGSVAEAQEAPGSDNSVGQQVVEEALKYRGVPYVLGGPEAWRSGMADGLYVPHHDRFQEVRP